MILNSFLFGRVAVDLVHTAHGSGGTRQVELIPMEDLSTPCGTIYFPAGKRVFFETVDIRDDQIIPLSGGRIRAVADW